MNETIKLTHLSLDSFNQKSFEIVFEVFENLKKSDLILVKEFIFYFDVEDLYESLKYHQKVLYSLLYTDNFDFIKDFTVWKYSVYLHRGLDLNYFLLEYEQWIFACSKYLYQAQAVEVIEVYNFLIANHGTFVKLAHDELEDSKKNPKYSIINDILHHILKGDKDKAKEVIIAEIKNSDNVFNFLENSIVPLMYKVGVLWQLNEISVAKEHLATSIIHEILDEVVLIDSNTTQKKRLAVVSVVGEELHTLGVKIVSKFLESKGFKTVQFASTLKKQDIINGIYEIKPDLVVFSITLSANLFILQQIVTELKESSIFKGYVIAGGQGLFENDKMASIKGIDLISKNLDAIDSFLDSL